MLRICFPPHIISPWRNLTVAWLLNFWQESFRKSVQDGKAAFQVINVHKYNTNEMIKQGTKSQTDFHKCVFTRQFNLPHGIIKWWDGNRNIPSYILPNWLHFTTSTTFVCVCVFARACSCVCVAALVGRSKTPVQSVFNFPEIKLHGRAITGALDYRKVILEIINRPQSVGMCKCLESVCAKVCPHACMCVCVLYIQQ